jgi:hypothetical protein
MIAIGRFVCGQDIPISHLSGEKFNQPIFGANSLTGYVSPVRVFACRCMLVTPFTLIVRRSQVPGRGLTGPCEFKLTFKDGSAATFLHFLFQVIETVRVAAMRASAPTIATMIQSGTFATASAAYVDPSDPSVLYVTQPYVPVRP